MSLGYMTTPQDEVIPTFPDDTTIRKGKVALLSELDVPDFILFFHENLVDPSLVPTILADMLKDRKTDRFSATKLQGFEGGDMTFSQSKEKISFYLA